MNMGKDSLAVYPGDIPLPPEDMWSELDNSRHMTSPQPEPNAPSAPSASAKPVAALSFIGSKSWSKDVSLDFPFEWEGRTITSITVSRLTTAQMGEIVAARGSDFDQWDIFAAMTGLPAPVLRGLESGDGDQVTGVAYDFLPRSLKKAG